MTIRVEVQANEEGRYTVRTRDGENGNVLLSSTGQLYERRDFATHVARRHFPKLSSATLAAFRAEEIEPVFLAVLDADGTVIESEQLR